MVVILAIRNGKGQTSPGRQLDDRGRRRQLLWQIAGTSGTGKALANDLFADPAGIIDESFFRIAPFGPSNDAVGLRPKRILLLPSFKNRAMGPDSRSHGTQTELATIHPYEPIPHRRVAHGRQPSRDTEIEFCKRLRQRARVPMGRKESISGRWRGTCLRHAPRRRPIGHSAEPVVSCRVAQGRLETLLLGSILTQEIDWPAGDGRARRVRKRSPRIRAMVSTSVENRASSNLGKHEEWNEVRAIDANGRCEVGDGPFASRVRPPIIPKFWTPATKVCPAGKVYPPGK
jgi:hypothetical protein